LVAFLGLKRQNKIINKNTMANYDSTTKDNKCIFCEITSGNLKTPGLFWEDN